MTLPGFAATRAAPGGPHHGGSARARPADRADRVLLQQFTCEEEMGPPCYNSVCKRYAHDPESMRHCMEKCVHDRCAV
ncbi:hypothetical protein [Streptomyces yaizuensis]|uniref:Uncharacterized protein n=1 Tax=Streptomyces yaizuensis TaxID=2989713 RepID=A0ABQ5P3M4_9ACTN|nr:hypothetical protein [Streptomyces sp. YSPA8]GLF97211.1 hypothetical protein SYYSPA8_22960 [Streptomyces sp. YSPA8]